MGCSSHGRDGHDGARDARSPANRIVPAEERGLQQLLKLII